MQETVRYRRTHYLIAKKFQLKYVGLTLLLVFLTAALCSYVVYYTSMLLIGDKLANVYPQGRLTSIVNAVNLRIVLSLILISPFIVMIGIYVSHKIAGPIYRIEKFLDGMAVGDFSSRLTLRRGDELVSLANGINSVVDSVKATIKEERANIENTAASLENIRRIAESKTISHGALNDSIDSLSLAVAKVTKELDKYKI